MNFENFIMNCCKAREWNLRSFLRKKLSEAGFSIIEDDYHSHRRIAERKEYKDVHNMLAIRGNNPRICLVAHTDVCRDHCEDVPNVSPVIKTMDSCGESRRIIQDRECLQQVGGDDRLGVAINAYIALNSGYDMGLLFTTDEEIGLISADYVRFPELNNFDLLVQVDRGNHRDQLVSNISGKQLCSDSTTTRLLKIADDIGLPRVEVQGFLTDVLTLVSNGVCKEAVNMTCGYMNSWGASSSEYIDIIDAENTMKYVSSIIKYFYLEQDKNDGIKSSSNEEEELYCLLKDAERNGMFEEKDYEKEKSYSDDWEDNLWERSIFV